MEKRTIFSRTSPINRIAVIVEILEDHKGVRAIEKKKKKGERSLPDNGTLLS